MRLKKAAALPGAIIICTILLIMSVTVSSLVIQSNTNTIVSNANEEKYSVFADFFNKFTQTGDTSLIESDRYTCKVYDGENNIKALVARDAVETLVFYGIYDFDNDDILAYQTSDFYITEVAGVSYLAGIVAMVEEE